MANNSEVVTLLPYQKRAVMEQQRIVILCWCRQAGKDFTTSLVAVMDGLETAKNWYIVSLTERQALATAKKAQMHCKAIFGILPEIGVSESYVNEMRITSYGVKLPNGAEIVALPGRDPDAIAGLTGNVILTEFALFPNGGRDHWRVIFPLATRGFKVWAISTPRGPDTKFSELRRNVAGKYKVHNVTIVDAYEQGLDLRDENGNKITPDELRALYADESGWNREYMCIEGVDYEQLISWEHINRSMLKIDGKYLSYDFKNMDISTAEKLVKNEIIPAVCAGNYDVGGWDIAVTGDISSFVLGTRDSATQSVTVSTVLNLRGLDDFALQKEIARSLLAKSSLAMVGDASGIGRQVCQELEKEFSESRFKGLVYTADSKSALFTQMMQKFQSGAVKTPQNLVELHYDVAALGRDTAGVANRLKVIQNRNPLEKHSHCDMACACAMMIDSGQQSPYTAGVALGFRGDDKTNEDDMKNKNQWRAF